MGAVELFEEDVSASGTQRVYNYNGFRKFMIGNFFDPVHAVRGIMGKGVVAKTHEVLFKLFYYESIIIYKGIHCLLSRRR